MTDGSINLDDHGVETKRFNVRDGTGLRLWTRLGYQVAIITGRGGGALRIRARELGITNVVQDAGDKAAAFEKLLQTLALPASQSAILADDLPDLPVMRRAGYPMAVADAAPEIIEAAAYVTTRPGGSGAVREAIEHLLRARQRWEEAAGLFA
jgi:3-deoxy-D-manno-octulosonate 8-phosphate phosphatase (KDO 8-P phosphatase)